MQLFICPPEVYSYDARQFLDPLLLALEVHRETRRKVQTLIAAKSMKRKAVGFFAGLMSSSEFMLLCLVYNG